MNHFTLPHSHNITNEQLFFKELSHHEKFVLASDQMKQLSDPTRLKIFWILCHTEECVINIAALLQMSSPAVSHHLRSMADSGLIVSRREGKEVYYKVSSSDTGELLHEMTEKMLEITCPVTQEQIHSTKELIEIVHEYLVSHLAERISIEDLAKQFHINPTSLKKGFKEVYGSSLAAHIKEHRMEYAASLLLESDKTIAEIARCVGYESQSRFTSAFKEIYGILPTLYRKTAQWKN